MPHLPLFHVFSDSSCLTPMALHELRTAVTSFLRPECVTPYGDVQYADLLVDILNWVPLPSKQAFDAVLHSCHAWRCQSAQIRRIVRATYTCARSCHMRFHHATKDLCLQQPCTEMMVQHIARFGVGLASVTRLSLTNVDSRESPLSDLASALGHLTHLTVSHPVQQFAPLDGVLGVFCRLCPLLESVHLLDAVDCTDATIERLAKAVPKLKVLKVSGSRSVGKSLKTVGEYCSGLESLTLVCCDKVDDACLKCLAGGCRKLRSIVLTYCAGVGNVGMDALGEACHHLEHVGLCGCTRVTDIFRLVSNSCATLRSLSAFGCKALGAASLKALGACSLLQKLNLSCIPSVDDVVVRSLLNCCPRLEVLEVIDNNVTDEILKSVTELGVNLCRLNISFTRVTKVGVESFLVNSAGSRMAELVWQPEGTWTCCSSKPIFSRVSLPIEDNDEDF